jgi:tetratricopeptide (TPR) repeat protein
LDVLAALIDQSLLQPREHDGAGRFAMLQTIREYALERLAERDDAQAVRRRHALYYLALAEQLEPSLAGPAQAAALDQLDQEHDQLRAALGWLLDRGDAGLALRLGGALGEFWLTRGHRSEGRQWLERALAVAAAPGHPQPPDSVLARALLEAGVLAQAQEDDRQAEAHFDASLALYRALDQPRSLARVLNCLGELALDQSDSQQATALFAEGLALARAAGDQPSIALLLYRMGIVAAIQGDTRRAQAAYEESLALRRALNDQRGIARVLESLGDLARRQGDHERARLLFTEGLALARAVGDHGIIAWLLHDTGYLALEHGDLEQAASLFAESTWLDLRLGFGQGVALGLLGLAAAADAGGQPERAARLLGLVERLQAAPNAASWTEVAPIYGARAAALQGQLEPSTFAAARALGRSLTVEEALHG